VYSSIDGVAGQTVTLSSGLAGSIYKSIFTATSGTAVISFYPSSSMRGKIYDIPIRPVGVTTGGKIMTPDVVTGTISVGGRADGAIGGSGMSGQAVIDVDTGNPLKVCLATRRSEDTTAALGSQIYFGRQRGSLLSAATVTAGDSLFDLYAYGHDGTDYAYSAAIHASVDGEVSANQIPGKIIMSTADSAGTMVDRLSLSSTTTGSAGHGFCWKTATEPGYCTSALDSAGTCTCK
jgi:hypothetical protein